MAEYRRDLGKRAQQRIDFDGETGTGKTYVYIKTMFELNKQYGANSSWAQVNMKNT